MDVTKVFFRGGTSSQVSINVLSLEMVVLAQA